MEQSLGSFGSAVGYYAFAFLMVVWMVIKIARGSGIMALLTFFFWPLSIISLIRNWGDRDTDIRIPFFAAVAALGMSYFMVARGVDGVLVEAAPYFTQEELDMIERENPDAFVVIMQARADFEAAGGNYEDLEYDDYGYEDAVDEPGGFDSDAPVPKRRPRAAPAVTSTTAEQTTAAAPLDPIVDLAQTAAAIAWRYGSVDLPAAHARLVLPSRFRFVPGNRLHRLARLRSQPLDVSVLGWISHETVDLGQPSAWAMEVRFYETGALAEGGDAASELDFAAQMTALGGAPSLEGGSRSLGNGAFAPQWDSARGLMTWSLEDPEGRSDHFALRPTRHGALLFRLPSLEPDQREFGLRATRLLAASVEVGSEWRWRGEARPGDATAPLTLLQWVQGRTPEPQTLKPRGV